VSAKVIAPIGVLAVAASITGVMLWARPEAESTRAASFAPLVEVMRATPGAFKLSVSAQGTVEPRTESELVSEVVGRIVWVSPNLASGGFFEADDVLVRVDPRDHEVALEGARAALARAESDLAHAEATLARQRSMRERKASSRQALDDAVHNRATAEAGVREARVAVRRAELDLERSQIRAPFAGRVRTKHVDVGRYLTPGVPVARIYSIDYAEVRLPIHDADLAYLDLPHGRDLGIEAPSDDDVESAVATSPGAPDHQPEVELSAEYAGRRHAWRGKVVRTEGALDERTRMINVVARVDDPYARGGGPDRSPLPVGLFVDAEIEGVEVVGVVALPRAAMRRSDSVWVVDDENRLHVRRVDVLRFGRDQTWIRGGLEAGERVVTSQLEMVTEGMKVRVSELPSPAASTAGSPTAGGPAS